MSNKIKRWTVRQQLTTTLEAQVMAKTRKEAMAKFSEPVETKKRVLVTAFIHIPFHDRFKAKAQDDAQ